MGGKILSDGMTASYVLKKTRFGEEGAQEESGLEAG